MAAESSAEATTAHASSLDTATSACSQTIGTTPHVGMGNSTISGAAVTPVVDGAMVDDAVDGAITAPVGDAGIEASGRDAVVPSDGTRFHPSTTAPARTTAAAANAAPGRTDRARSLHQRRGLLIDPDRVLPLDEAPVLTGYQQHAAERGEGAQRADVDAESNRMPGPSIR